MSDERISPAEAWSRMVKGNQRFIHGTPQHPRQDVERRTEIALAQYPEAALFGCADSRLSAEIIFDKGLGDLFVVRNAGQIISNSVIGSLEYAVEMLKVSLILVLSHDSCGAVQAAIEQDSPEVMPLPHHIHDITASIAPAVTRVRLAHGLAPGDPLDENEVGQEHLRDTVSALLSSSELIGEAIAEGKLALVGANYRLAEGLVTPHVVIGSLER